MKRLMIGLLSVLFSLPQLVVNAEHMVSEIEVNEGFKVSQYDALNQCFDNDNFKLAYQYHMHFLVRYRWISYGSSIMMTSRFMPLKHLMVQKK